MGKDWHTYILDPTALHRYRLPCYICQAGAITGACSGPSVSHACAQSCIVLCILKPSTTYQRQVQPVRSSDMCCLVMHLYYCVVYATWHMVFLYHNKAVLLILHTDVLACRHLCCLVADEAMHAPLSLSEMAFGCWVVNLLHFPAIVLTAGNAHLDYMYGLNPLLRWERRLVTLWTPQQRQSGMCTVRLTWLPSRRHDHMPPHELLSVYGSRYDTSCSTARPCCCTHC